MKSKKLNITKTYLKDLTYRVNGAAMEVHKALGPGLLENVYHRCLTKELELRGIEYASELEVPVAYKGMLMETNLRCDLLVEGVLALELKAVAVLLPIHEAQLIRYMKLLKVPKGILLNFNVANLYREGQKTFVNESFKSLPD